MVENQAETIVAQGGVSKIRERLDLAPLSRAQMFAVGLIVAMSVVDGYDLLAMSLVAPVVSHDWGIGKAALGVVLAASLMGMAAGSLLISPLADVLGRKPVLLSGLVLTSIGTILSAFTHNVAQLGASRGLTGLGIGIMVPLLATMAAEFSNAKRRGLLITLSTLGQPLGGIIGGLTAAAILRHHSWTLVFLYGGIGTALLVPIIALTLPESPSYLISRRPTRALERLNAVLTWFAQSPVLELPPRPSDEPSSYRALFKGDLRAVTLRLTFINVLVVMAAYYLISWLPQLIADAGFAPSTAGLVSVVVSVVGIPGGIFLGVLTAGSGPQRLAGGAMIGLGLALAALGYVPPKLPLILVCSAACGFFLSGCTGVFYAAVADSYTALTRASGIGFVMGIGRVFSAFGPLTAGALFQAGASRGEVSLMFGACVILAGILFASSSRSSRPLEQVSAA